MQATDDSTLKKRVEDELDWAPMVDESDIGVLVEEGVVTLTGTVRSYSEKLAAEAAVKRVKGVRAVVEQLEVRFLGPPDLSDAEIARRAVNVLDWDVSIPRGRVMVTVEDGHVTLTGTVDWRYQADQARIRMGNLPGVTRVTSHLTVRPAMTADNVKQRIENALARVSALEAKGIRIEVKGSEVTLEGEVDAWADREIAEQAAWSAPGVTSVIDRIRVR